METFGGEAVQLVKLRNPLGPGGEYVGAWTRGGLEWDEVPPAERERLAVRNMADGEFWLVKILEYDDENLVFMHDALYVHSYLKDWFHQNSSTSRINKNKKKSTILTMPIWICII